MRGPIFRIAARRRLVNYFVSRTHSAMPGNREYDRPDPPAEIMRCAVWKVVASKITELDYRLSSLPERLST